jgi:hypothetical protein
MSEFKTLKHSHWQEGTDSFGAASDGAAYVAEIYTPVPGYDDLVIPGTPPDEQQDGADRAVYQLDTAEIIRAGLVLGCPGLSHNLGRRANVEILAAFLA